MPERPTSGAAVPDPAGRPRVVVLGAGPAGVGAAFALRRADGARVSVVEQRDRPGGNAASFEIGGQRVDYGSHRLHPACEPEILADIRELLGNELLERPRHGRIRLRGRWIHFPLKPWDLLLRLDRAFAAGALADMARRVLPGGPAGGETFASVLRARLGPTICEHFYFPYARKIWGLEPDALSAIQARRRVAASSVGKLVRKVLGQLPGVKPVGFSHYYYPRRGYGAISEAYADAAVRQGAEIHLGHRVDRVERDPATGTWRVHAAPAEPGGGARLGASERRPTGDEEASRAGGIVLEGDHLWSTIPITALARMTRPEPPAEVLEASTAMRYRSMLLVYLTLGMDRFSEFDAHYFPGAEIPITRLSEPKVYADLDEPRGRTTLCAELPCAPSDEWWGMPEAELAERTAEAIASTGLPRPTPLEEVNVRRLRFAYPIYEIGYERHFDTLDAWASALPGVLTFGRQGLFAHDNTHHALTMAYAAARCLGPQGFDAARWAEYRTEFESHVVED